MPDVQADGEHVGKHEGGANRGHKGFGCGARIQRHDGGVTTDGAVLHSYHCDFEYLYKMNKIDKLKNRIIYTT